MAPVEGRLKVESLEFQYKRGTFALDGFNCSVPSGRTAILGPNGAGKSTLASVIAGMRRPHQGQIFLPNCEDPATAKQLRNDVALMWQSVAAVPGLTVRQQVEYACWLGGCSLSESADRAMSALDSVELTEKVLVKASTLSGGQLRRLGLAQVLVSKPKILLLDEPTAGLDPGQRLRFRRLLQEIHGPSHILVSTHQTEDIEESYNYIVVINNGRCVFEGTTPTFLSLDNSGDAEQAYLTLVGSAAEA